MKYRYRIFDDVSDYFNQQLSFKEKKISELTKKIEIKNYQIK